MAMEYEECKTHFDESSVQVLIDETMACFLGFAAMEASIKVYFRNSGNGNCPSQSRPFPSFLLST